MDAHRRYAEEPEPSWYAGQRSPDTSGSFAAQNPGATSYDSGVHERPSGAFRLPDQRPADPYATPLSEPGAGSHAAPPPSPAESGQIRIPVRGPEYPAIRPSGEAGFNDPTSMVPVAGRQESRPESVYSASHPVSAIMFAVVTVILLVPSVLLLVQATFVDDPSARGVVPAVLLTLGLPLTGTGLYSLAAGGRAGTREAWLRPPLAYLPVGLLLLLAAGLGVA
ncbi:hypothetical protein [Winogradskya humida]|uniref:Uncharacterized protein n=1 Tax=Winogradskya humida TaxID=113566 RepID=A0ABQ3ZSF9_9ACTN|nr:hypothetical protein [Actinoplanes humidus]GIE21521.1 hypothetical protein Ahu01nite_046230 [Actinoplanes humidus]